MIPEKIKERFLIQSIFVMVSGTVFFIFPSVIIKIISYTLLNATLILFDILFMKTVYSCKTKIQGRLFSLSQLIDRFSIPLASCYLSFFSESFLDFSLIFSFVLLMTIAMALFFNLEKVGHTEG